MTIAGPLVRITEDFPASTAVTYVGGVLVGACAGEAESYVMRWPALPGPYEPLLVLPGEAVALGGTRRSSTMVVLTRHEEDRLGVTWLDVDRGRRAELVTPGDLRLAVESPPVMPSPDDRWVAIAGVRATTDEPITLVFELSPEPRHRWMLTGFATRWHDGRLILLEPHGASAWTPGVGTEFLGDAPPQLSPDGRWAIALTEQGLDVKSTTDAIVRSVAIDEAHRVVAGWCGERPVLGDRDPLLLSPATLDLEPLWAAGHVLRALSDDGTRAIVDDGEWLYAAPLAVER